MNEQRRRLKRGHERNGRVIRAFLGNFPADDCFVCCCCQITDDDDYYDDCFTHDTLKE